MGIWASQQPFERSSEERRVGKECRSRWSPYHQKNTEQRSLVSALLLWFWCRLRGVRLFVRNGTGGYVLLLGGMFFFFQAQDGIRVGTVTGVQTCALPISFREPEAPREGLLGADRVHARAGG